ncbi:MAG TPA: hypothetical protein VIK07_10890 [Bacteroidales bacterium]
MKTNIIFSIIILLMIAIQNLNGQSRTYLNNSDLNNSEWCLTGELFVPDFTVDARTYFYSEWVSGNIYLSNGEVVRNKLIKYNGLLDQLFWLEPKSNNMIKLDKESILRFHFSDINGDSSVYFRKIKVKRNLVADSVSVFAQEIYCGSSSLFIVHALKENGTELVRKNGILSEEIVYTELPIYFFRFANQKTFVTKSIKRHSLYAFFPENKDKIKEFTKTNNPGMNQDNLYLIRLTKFLGTLDPRGER